MTTLLCEPITGHCNCCGCYDAPIIITESDGDWWPAAICVDCNIYQRRWSGRNPDLPARLHYCWEGDNPNIPGYSNFTVSCLLPVAHPCWRRVTRKEFYDRMDESDRECLTFGYHAGFKEYRMTPGGGFKYIPAR